MQEVEEEQEFGDHVYRDSMVSMHFAVSSALAKAKTAAALKELFLRKEVLVAHEQY